MTDRSQSRLEREENAKPSSNSTIVTTSVVLHYPLLIDEYFVIDLNHYQRLKLSNKMG